MRIRNLLTVLFLVATLALPASALAQEGEGEAIIFSTSADVVNWNWIIGDESGSSEGQRWLYQSLVGLDPFTGEIIPSVATGWEISEDGRTYTVTMRDDIVWSDGEPVDAHDVKFTADALYSDLVQTSYRSQFNFESVEVIDDYTVKFTFPDANCEALSQLGMSILPSHKFAPDFSDFMTNPWNLQPDISAGPYILSEWVPDDYYALTANPTYVETYPGVEAPAKIDNVFVRVIVNDAARNAAFEAEEVDWGSVGVEGLKALQDVEFLNFFEYNNKTTTYFFAFNLADPNNPQPAYDADGNPVEQAPHPIFGDKRVRQALVMGWDHDAGIEAALSGHGARVSSPVPPSMGWAYNSEVEPWPYDPEAAKALLEEAGWVDTDGDGIRDKDGVPLSFEFLLATGGGQWEILALLAQDQWRQNLGVDMRITSMEFGALVDELVNQTFEATIIGFGGGDPQPDGIVRSMYLSTNDAPGEGFNMASYINPEIDRLVDEGLYMPGCKTEDRAPIYYQIQEILREDVPADFIYINTTIIAAHQKIQGIDPEAAWGTRYNITEWTISE